MKETLDTLIVESKEAFEEIKNNVERSSVEFSDDASIFWTDLKASFDEVENKLQHASREYADKAEKSAYLSMMEAKYKLLDLQDLTERFTSDVLNSSENEIEIAKYQAELASFKAENTWEKIKDEVAETYETSKEEVEKLAVAASNEVKEIFAKLKSLV
jgi:light-regulated signal transduction histidine kinase (bacteriophytochrome)